VSYIPNPTIYESDPRGGLKGYDLYSRLLKEHIIVLGTPINDDVANMICAQLLYLQYDNAERDINLYINSPGGDITALFAIYDTMQLVRNQISTWCYGQAASAAAVLLSAGAVGKRYALPHSRILLHQPYGGVGGQATDIEIQAKEILRMREMLEQILGDHTGQPLDRIHRDTDRDFIMGAQEARDYGIIDEIISGADGPAAELRSAGAA
jgi:ATP-dependent Clp protease protease subunit